MPKQNNSKPPPARSPVVTRIQTQASTSTIQPVENQTTVPATPITKQENRRPEIIFVSPTKGPLTLEQLRKSTQDITARV